MLNQVRGMGVFAAVVEAGSLRGAARSLNMSPSVVSHHISRLEAELGTALIYRSTRKLSMTEAGERMARLSSEMMRVAHEALTVAGAVGERLIGQIRLTAPPLIAWSPFSAKFASFSHLHPDVRLIIDFTDDREDLIEKRYDLAIRMGDPHYASWRSRKLMQLPRCLVASPAYAALHPPVAGPEDLRQWRWVHFTALPRSVDMTGPGGERIGLWGKDGITVNLGRAMYELALTGAGVAPLPRFVVQEALDRGALVELLPDWRIRPFDIFALRPPNTPPEGLVHRFIEHLHPAAGPRERAPLRETLFQVERQPVIAH